MQLTVTSACGLLLLLINSEGQQAHVECTIFTACVIVTFRSNVGITLCRKQEQKWVTS